jgi:PAS domain S-box-containing protein
MTLRVKSILFSAGALLLMIIFIAVFYTYRSANNKLFELITILETLKHYSHEIKMEILSAQQRELDIAKIKKIISSVPDLSRKLRETSLSGEERAKLINAELSFMRIDNALDSYLTEKDLKRPLLAQIHNETDKIAQSVNLFLDQSEREIYILKIKTERLIYMIYFIIIAGIIGALVYMSRLFINPILMLSRQVEDIKNGVKENIDFRKTNDEIGRLAEFTSATISDIRAQSKEVQTGKIELEYHFNRQLALSQILKLSTESKSMDEFLEGVLKIILSLAWLKIESKGGIFLVEGDPPVLVLKNSLNFSPEIINTCSSVSLGRCICGKAAESKKIMYVDCVDERHENTYEGMTPHGHYCLPIIFGSELLGVIVLYLSHKMPEQPYEVTFLADVAGIIADVIIRKKLEDKHKLISAAIEQAGEGVLITDIQGNIQYANPAISNMTGYDVKELLGSKTGILNSGRQSHEFYKEMWETILSGKDWEGTLINKRRDGSFYDEKMVITPVKDRKARITNFVAIKMDITKEKRLEEQLLHAQKMDALGTLAGGVAHDFNNILTAVLGYAELLKDGMEEDNPQYKAVSIIEDSAKKGAALASSILNATRKEKFQFSIVNLNDTIKSSLELLSRTIPKIISIELGLEPDLPNIKGDTTQLQQIIINLTLNAKDAMPEGGKLFIGTGRSGKEHIVPNGLPAHEEFIKLTVSDTGKGIEKDVINKIFDPFFTTKDRGSGTGLGLYIVHSIVSNHGGHINFYSEPGHGTTINIYFPAINESPRAEELSEDEDFTGSGTVLVIDDEPNVRELSQDMLQGLGYSVITAADGKEGIEIYRNKTIDIVVLDMIMPVMNGPEVFKNLKAIDPEVSVIIVSGYDSEGFAGIKGLMESGVKGFVQKPFTQKAISKVLKQALKQ